MGEVFVNSPLNQKRGRLSSSFSIQFMLSWTASSNRTVRFGFSSALSSSTRADSRGAKRIVFSNDGLIYYTEDHYKSFELLYGEE